MSDKPKLPDFTNDQIVWIGTCISLQLPKSEIITQLRVVFPDFGADLSGDEYCKIVARRLMSNGKYYELRAEKDRLSRVAMGDVNQHIVRAEMIWRDLEQDLTAKTLKPHEKVKYRSLQLSALKYAAQYLDLPEPALAKTEPDLQDPDDLDDSTEPSDDELHFNEGRMQDISSIFGGIGSPPDLKKEKGEKV